MSFWFNTPHIMMTGVEIHFNLLSLHTAGHTGEQRHKESILSNMKH